MFKARIFIVFFLFGVLAAVNAQDHNLATQYFANGEYEKASVLFGQLVEKDDRNDYFFNRYLDCLLNLENWQEAETALRKRLKKFPENTALYVNFGQLYERQGLDAQANEQYKRAIDKVAPDYAAISKLAQAFNSAGKTDFAIQTYEHGSEAAKDPGRFAFNLGELYRRKGDMPKMIRMYLYAIDGDPGKTASIQSFLSRYLAPDDYTELQRQLYELIQKDQENPSLVELLAWSFVQRRDFKSAFRQFKALDQRFNENGQRIYNLANDAADARDYETAIAAYEYIVQEKGPLNPFFSLAKREGLNCRRKKITEGFGYTLEELQTLEKEYNTFLDEFGTGRATAEIIIDLADLQGYYINNLPKAIALLDRLRQSPGLDRTIMARVKINLADFYLMAGEIWESTLLYSQVDKDFKEEQLGQEARFKNARLSYFNGDFQWSQAQFDILKASTSKLISNDAIDLSVFIMDNLNMDSSVIAIGLYSAAELLVLQNKFDDAFRKLDTLRRDFPDHALQDDILYLEAQIFEKRRDFNGAALRYQEIIDKYSKDIRADNSLYALAQLYEFKLNNPQKAQPLYEKLFIDYSGSVFAVDARKRFRILRGDKVQ